MWKGLQGSGEGESKNYETSEMFYQRCTRLRRLGLAITSDRGVMAFSRQIWLR